jgi:hypothetical protein
LLDIAVDFSRDATLSRHAELVSASILQKTQSMRGEIDPGAAGVQSTNKFRVTM